MNDEFVDYEPEHEDDLLVGPEEAMDYINPDLARLNLPRDFKEYARCLESKYWRLNNLYFIINEHGEKTLFRFNENQEYVWRHQWFLNLLLKARQWGGTTFVDINFLDDCLFTPDLEAGIIAHNKEDAQKIFRRKVLYPYKNLPPSIKASRPLITDSRTELAFANGSSIFVGVSMRSGTVQRLHISEFGKICAKYPDKAEEIVTGSLNAIHAGEQVFIESTAEGAYGRFYDMCQTSKRLRDEGRKETLLDYRLIFIPWFWKSEYALTDEDTAQVTITTEMAEYFDKIETLTGAKFTRNQKAWYVKKEATLGDKMKQEYPSTEDEPFEVAIDGAIYAREMTRMRKEKRICLIPVERGIPVNTFWDLGRNDENPIIFHQRVGMENRIVDYYVNHHESIDHYVTVLQNRGYVYGTHYFPHDMNVTDYSRADGKSRYQVFRSLMTGASTELVERADADLQHGIQLTRDFLATCWIDKTRCGELIKALDNYQHEWDERMACFKSHPLHNWASHPCDAMRTGAVGYRPRIEQEAPWRHKRRNAMTV